MRRRALISPSTTEAVKRLLRMTILAVLTARLAWLLYAIASR